MDGLSDLPANVSCAVPVREDWNGQWHGIGGRTPQLLFALDTLSDRFLSRSRQYHKCGR
jgi:hypothetical protein